MPLNLKLILLGIVTFITFNKNHALQNIVFKKSLPKAFTTPISLRSPLNPAASGIETPHPTSLPKDAIPTRRLVLVNCLSISASLFIATPTQASPEPDLTPYQVILTVRTDPKSPSTSEILIEVRPDWAPLAASRFKELVESGFYTGSRFHRVLPGYVAQFGIAADPTLNKKWLFCEKNCRALPDEPRKVSNKRGTLSFASAGKNSRQTQVFVNLGNNDGPPNFLDGQNFVPFARVEKGMEDVMKVLNSEYGVVESISGGLAGSVNQGKAAYFGAEYLDALFPKLSIIESAKIM